MNLPLPLPLFLSTVAVRTGIIFLVLVIGLRVFGKRNVGELNLLDIVTVALLGNAVQNALTYGSGRLDVGLVSAGVLLLADRLVGIVYVRGPWQERRLSGEPTMIVHDGRVDRREMRRQGVTDDELLAAMRNHGVAEMSQVHLAILENDGSISIISKDHEA